MLGYIGISNFIKNNDLLNKENFGVIVFDKLFYKNYVVEEYKNSLLNPRSILTLYHMSSLKISIANDLLGSFIMERCGFNIFTKILFYSR